jgi:anti-sigma regulatory factor (Ser/Thr protein kinase)
MPEDALWTRDITLESQATSAAQARRFVRQHLDTHHLGAMTDDVELVASELATNAMQHAGTPCHLRLEAFDDTLRLTVSDGSTLGPVHLAAEPLDTSGRGLEIVSLLSRSWGYLEDGDGKSVWAEFDPARASEEGRPPPRREARSDQ